MVRAIKAVRAAAQAGVAIMAVAAATASAAPNEVARVRVAIPAQPLDSALGEFARQSKQQLLFSPGVVKGLRAKAVNGVFAPDQALGELLEGTGLRVRATPSGAFLVVASSEQAGLSDTQSGIGQVASGPAGAATGQGASSKGEAVAGSAAAESESAEEIVVTAQKRAERLIDVPLPVTVVNSEALSNTNQLRVQDYYQRIPGLNLTTAGNGNDTSVSIRGITTGPSSNPTVGIVVDDVPFGPSITLSVVPDIDPNNLSRIEVLRGPQGSLYGASSMGGLIKFVTPEPSTSEVSGMIQAGVTGVDESKDVGYSTRGHVNVPLGETLAIRASAHYRLDPGYIDNVATGESDINDIRSKGGHTSLLWAPSSTFSVRLGALVQSARRAGTDEADLSLDDTRLLDKGLPFTGASRQRAEVYSGVVKAELGNVDLTSVSAYNYSSTASRLDATPLLGGAFANLSNRLFGVRSTYLPFSIRTKAYTQELRLDVPVTSRVNWLLGGLIDHENLAFINEIDAFDPATGDPIGTVTSTRIMQKYRNYALFSNLDLSLSDHFSIQVGGRLSTNRQKSRTLRSGTGRPTADSGNLKSDESPFTFSVAPQWKIRPNLMAYARVASGYRPGGPNINCGTPNVACTYESDRTVNYELGLKGDFANRLISIDASAYRIDWDDIQTLVSTPNGRSGFTANGATARSQGVELSLALRPSGSTTIEGWIAYNDGELTEDFPAAAGLAAIKGDRLPFGARWSGTIGANQDFTLTDAVDAFVGGNVSYVGKRVGTFQPDPERSIFPSYWQFDLTAGVKWDSGWRLNAFVTNLTDERGILRTGADSNIPTAVTYIRPRNFGLAVSKTF